MNVSLTAGVRSNLLSLQSTSALMSQTQARLGSGKKVQSAVDDPTAFFTAQALTNRASDLTARLDGMAKGIQTVKAATTGIQGINDLLKQAKGIAQDARALSTTGDATADAQRSAAKTKFDAVMDQINSLAKDSGYDGVNLLKGDSLTVQFEAKSGSSTLSVTGKDFTTGNAALISVDKQGASTVWLGSNNNVAIDAAIKKIEDSVSNLQTETKTFGGNLATLTTRQTFAKSMIDTLTTGSDNLTNADLNVESANMLALNTQNSMGVSALSLASQASQSILKLLG
jgi:flagellin-like hook-associated protein FlgL